ncbi:MAG: FecR family protein, partial [Asticcacaulis sp.]
PHAAFPDSAEGWFARHQSGEPPAAAEAEDARLAFRDWMSNPDHAAAYRALSEDWRALAAVAKDPRILALRARALSQISLEREQPVAPPRRAKPGLTRRHLWWGGGAAVAASTVAATALVGGDLFDGAGLFGSGGTLYATGAGQRTVVQLADGSELTLAPRTRLRVHLRPGSRDLELEAGEAIFAVAKDRSRPFRVRAGDRTVEATGTAFQIARNGEGADVLLLEGGVRVQNHVLKTEHHLVPGQRLTSDLAVRRLDAAAVEARTAWRDGELIFRSQPLAAVVADFNRYSADRVALGDAGLGQLRVSGVFRYDGAEAFVLSMQSVFGLSVTRTGPRAWRLDRAITPAAEPVPAAPEV